jgi:serpin B
MTDFFDELEGQLRRSISGATLEVARRPWWRWPRRLAVAGVAALTLVAIGVAAVSGIRNSGNVPSRPANPVGAPPDNITAAPQAAHSPLKREAARLRSTEARSLTGGSLAFAVDLYRELAREQGNLAFSPFSLTTALAMTYPGARGETAAEMAKTLHFDGSAPGVARGFGAVDQTLANANRPGVRLGVANSLWGQQGVAFRRPYLDLLARNFGAGIELVDYERDREAARAAINAWVAHHTRDKIRELLAPGVLDALTRLVLVNAVYLKADWKKAFERSRTHDGPFFTDQGKRVTASMMTKTDYLAYYRGGHYQAVELPYRGDRLAMVIVIPDRGMLDEFGRGLSERSLDRVVGALAPARVRLTMPKFTFRSSFQLGGTLRSLGLGRAFSDRADFSGMAERVSLKLKEVVHQAYVKVDEKGTEAAGATGVVVDAVSAKPPALTLKIDRPFLFLIRDRLTGAPLFLGRVVDPARAR